MPKKLTPGDINAIYTAIRARLQREFGGSSFASAPATTVGPHTHHASEIVSEPAGTEWTGYISAEDVQAAIQEIDDEKLARSGVQPMKGGLQMDDGAGPWPIYDILNLILTGGVGQARIDDARALNFKGTTVGEDAVTNCRAVHMIGDDADDEARVDGLDRVKFNATETQAVIESPARMEWQTGVTPGTDYTAAAGIMSWSDVEGTAVVNVASGPGA